MATAGEESSSTSATQPEELDPMIVHLAQDMFRKTADYLNGEFDSACSQLLFYYGFSLVLHVIGNRCIIN